MTSWSLYFFRTGTIIELPLLYRTYCPLEFLVSEEAGTVTTGMVGCGREWRRGFTHFLNKQ